MADKKKKHPYHKTEIEHHPDGSHTVRHHPHRGDHPDMPVESYAAGDMDALKAGLERNIGPEAAAAPPPAAPAAAPAAAPPMLPA